MITNGAPVERVSNGAPVEHVSNGAPVERVLNGAPVKRVSNGAPVERVLNGAPVELVYQNRLNHGVGQSWPTYASRFSCSIVRLTKLTQLVLIASTPVLIG